ncbi:helix-turn-helix domain-containing protein [Porphyromonas levii]|uniref:Helix-turn-helix domain-containing protein n=1 Tax=Porphyromonas levii TaxID=28114 RepID=A0A4Y8WMY9_9PORP|nr:helix-turn-helix domain-containing protein [Porphyromonas levii]TFH94476.1 helix-turn-helix domain-containing protein [Porphyromonas levii]TFH94917.1 helix-turn-helix domain-containing protein [Porphyromonas levii]
MLEHEGEKLYTAQEVCEIVGYKRSTLQARVRAGILPQLKIKNRSYYREEDVLRLRNSDDGDIYCDEKRQVAAWTKKEMASILGISITTLERWENCEKIRAVRKGGFVFYTRETIQPLLSRMKEKCQERGKLVNDEFGTIE